MPVNDARQQLIGCLSAPREKQDAMTRREDVAAAVREMRDTPEGDLSPPDVRLYHELEGLARFIQRAKTEIADIRREESAAAHITTATDELDAIVEATEEATGVILDAAETIEAVAARTDDAAAAALRGTVTSIYEACNFQDITGQRIGKVVKALKHIEGKVDALIASFPEEVKRAGHKARAGADTEAGSEGTDDDLLRGPQRPGEGISQEDIDALLAD